MIPLAIVWTIENLLIAIVIIAAAAALVHIALREFGTSIPGWVAQVLWILVVAFVCVMAIRIVLSL